MQNCVLGAKNVIVFCPITYGSPCSWISQLVEVKQYKKSVEEQENCDNFLKMIWKIEYKHNYCALITFETFDIHDYF